MRKRLLLPPCNYLTLLPSNHIPLGLKHHTTGITCLCEPSKACCTLYKLFSQANSITVAWHTPTIPTAPCTRAQYSPFNSQPPEPSDLSFTTTSNTSSKFTAFKPIMPTDKKDLAVVEQENNKCPIIHPGELNAKVFHAFKTACHN